MSDARELVDRYYQAFNDRDWNSYEQLFNAEAETLASGGATVHGVQAVRDWDKSWIEAFPDGRITSERKTPGGAIVASENRFTGTHTGTLHTPAGDVPPTGKRVDVPYVAIFEVQGDQLKTQHIYYDTAELQSQLGLQ